MHNMYAENQLVRIAKRENNNKRKYLVVNRLQGKHMPVSPNEAFEMFHGLADIIKKEYPREKLLLIGFAETATAIGAAAAAELKADYMQTTREQIADVEYLFFTETHSHATEQKLVKNDLDRAIEQVQRIIFIEDEVTTGNTILNIIDIIEKKYKKEIQFSVASLLNGMEPESLRRYRERAIAVHYLVKTNHSGFTQAAEAYKGDGAYVPRKIEQPECKVWEISASGYQNARRIVNGAAYRMACEKLWSQLKERLSFQSQHHILVIGTEEFMFPALYIAKKMEDMGISVKSHSTTRSPIAVSTEPDYPLHYRFELTSLYEETRTTYLYDIGTYDAVYILTDADPVQVSGINSLVNALHSCGNDSITLIRWQE